MSFRLAPTLLLLCLSPLLAQVVPPERTLAQLQRAFDQQWQALGAGDAFPTREQQGELLRRQIGELEQFLAHEAKGDDRWNGRLMLADMRLGQDDAKGATQALTGIDKTSAPGLVLLAAAEIAARLGDDAGRGRWIEAALLRPATLPERMAMARVLMTHLREVQKGEAIIEQALAKAKDTAARAEVLWYRAEALREREDLPENTYYEALEELASQLPDTYWGGVARDRALASRFTVGGPAIPFTVELPGGGSFALEEQKGKVVVLAFWSAEDPGSEMVALLKGVRQGNADRLALLGIGVDPDPTAFAARSASLGVDWPQVCDGRGPRTDLALRHHVETVPTILVIDRRGRIAGMNLHTGTASARDELREVVRRALAAR